MKEVSKRTGTDQEDIFIRKMEIEDLDQILPIAVSTPFNPWTRHMFLGEMANPFSHTFIMNKKESSVGFNSPVGFICFRHIEEESELLNLAIHSSMRHKGYGKKLMNFYLEFCNQNGVKKYYLEVHPLNSPAIALYVSCGFRVVGKRVKFYQGGYDALLMERQ